MDARMICNGLYWAFVVLFVSMLRGEIPPDNLFQRWTWSALGFLGVGMAAFDVVVLLSSYEPRGGADPQPTGIEVVEGELVADVPGLPLPLPLPARVPQTTRLIGIGVTVLPMSGLGNVRIAWDDVEVKWKQNGGCQNCHGTHQHYHKDGFEFCDQA